MLTENIKRYISKSVLCWLATSSSDNLPNVSPKEVFMAYKNESIIIANIASPKSVKNIAENENVCISFIDIFVQKGFQLKGKAEIIVHQNPEFTDMKKCLEKITNGKYSFSSIIKINITEANSIIAPSYFLYPDISDEKRIAGAKKSYGI